MEQSAVQRVAVYIDGMNLFYGLRSKRRGLKGDSWPCYYWLDLHHMSQRLLRDGQVLKRVSYFTARVDYDPEDPDKQRDQNIYLEALKASVNVEVEEGYFMPKVRACQRCGASWKTYEEKMTDVKIALSLLNDAQNDMFDTAIVVSADSDLVAPISMVLEKFDHKRIIVAFPPDRVSKQLRQVATGYVSIGQDVCRNSQLPVKITNREGYTLTRPESWV